MYTKQMWQQNYDNPREKGADLNDRLHISRLSAAMNEETGKEVDVLLKLAGDLPYL